MEGRTMKLQVVNLLKGSRLLRGRDSVTRHAAYLCFRFSLNIGARFCIAIPGSLVQGNRHQHTNASLRITRHLTVSRFLVQSFVIRHGFCLQHQSLSRILSP